jgi:hypothetical protein
VDRSYTSRSPEDLVARVTAHNRATEHLWRPYEAHRRRITDVLSRLAADGGRSACLIGAGNCNDLDLTELGQRFASIHLVDLDRIALETGVDRQLRGGGLRRRVEIHGDIDVSGVLATLADGSRIPSARSLAQTAREAPRLALDGAFDVVASICVLTQLIDTAVTAVGPNYPNVAEVVLALRDRHLRVLGELARPGGSIAFVTDLVSTDTAPELRDESEEGLTTLMQRLIEERNFVTGANPAAIEHVCRTDPQLARRLVPTAFEKPWVWDLGTRAYLVYALVFHRR